MDAESYWKPSRNGGSSSKLNQSKKVGKGVSAEEHFSQQWYARRRKISQAIIYFREALAEVKHEASSGGMKFSGIGMHMRAVKDLQTSGKWLYNSKEIGEISGIKVGEKFHFRAELKLAGLHLDFQRGIDYRKLLNGKTVATSIVDSGRYENTGGGADLSTVVYSGQGENPEIRRGKKLKDQLLKGGNLALMNSMYDKIPVRVIRKFKNFSTFTPLAAAVEGNEYGDVFVYIGLYHVTNFWQERGKFGKYVYKFFLQKLEGQPALDFGKLKMAKNGYFGSVSGWK